MCRGQKIGVQNLIKIFVDAVASMGLSLKCLDLEPLRGA